MTTQEYFKALVKVQREFISKVKDGVPKDEYLAALAEMRSKVDEIEKKYRSK